ncbi:hypothetical protein B0H16DRAFT_1704735 [Mycena metata]|uniref:Uncharacterized protein n=1 Tax=Mycena metata TaxID=1033252 RepID=A0AAD7M7I6_9AGAR|nr:hypothetical protein B0H16DRAFT_1704735 [Mycena metata]
MVYGRYHCPGPNGRTWYLPRARRRRAEILGLWYHPWPGPQKPLRSKHQKGCISSVWAPFWLPKGLSESPCPGLSLVNGPWYGHSLADYLGTGPVRKLSARAIESSQLGLLLVNGPWYGHSLADYLGTGPVRKLSARAIGCSKMGSGAGIRWLITLVLGLLESSQLGLLVGTISGCSEHFDISRYWTGLLENGLGCGYPSADCLGTGLVRKLSAMAAGGCDIRVFLSL